MDNHPRTGFGPDTTQDDFAAAGSAEIARMKRAQRPKSPNRHEAVVNAMQQDNALALTPADFDTWFRVHTKVASDARAIIVEMHRRNMIKGEAQ